MYGRKERGINMDEKEIEEIEQKINMNFDLMEKCEEVLKEIYDAEKALNGGE